MMKNQNAMHEKRPRYLQYGTGQWQTNKPGRSPSREGTHSKKQQGSQVVNH